MSAYCNSSSGEMQPVSRAPTPDAIRSALAKLTPEGRAKHTARSALAIAERGGKVFPMRFIKDPKTGKTSKVPAIKGWPQNATGDPRQIKRWFDDRHGLGIGIATEPSSWTVLDTDQKPGIDGDANLRALLGEHAHYLDETETVLTPTGSKHYRFTGDPVKSTASVLAPGVDIKSRGGYVVGEGTISDKGVYRVIANAGTRLPLPQALIDIIASAYASTAKVEQRKLPEGVEVPGDDPRDIEQGRDYLRSRSDDEIDGYTNAMDIGRKLGDFGILPETAAQLFDDEINPRLPAGREWDMDELVMKMNDWDKGRENAFGCDSYAAAVHDFDDLPDDFADLNDGLIAAANDNDSSGQTGVLARNTLDLAALSGKPVPDRSWHVDGWIPGNNVTLLYGDGGTGKSLAAMQLAVATAVGRRWFGLPVRQGRVIYLTAEDDGDELHRRIADIASLEGLSFHDLAAKLKVISLTANDPALAVASGDGDRIKTTKLWRELVGTIGDFRPNFVVLDTLADVFAGNENVRNQARGFIAQLRAPAIAHDAAFLALAHPSRAGLDKSGFNAAAGSSGSTAWHNSVRSRLLLERDNDKDRDSRTLTSVKANYGPVGSTIQLRWTNGVFATTATAGGEAAAQEAERVFLEMLDAYTAEGRHVSATPGTTYAPAKFAEDAQARTLDKKQLAAAMNRLFAADAIKVVTEGPPSKPRSRIVRVVTELAAA